MDQYIASERGCFGFLWLIQISVYSEVHMKFVARNIFEFYEYLNSSDKPLEFVMGNAMNSQKHRSISLQLQPQIIQIITQ